MRTRRSPRNQEILFKALFPKPEPPTPLPPSIRCWDCEYYPKGGRVRGHCRLRCAEVAGIGQDRPCWTARRVRT
jgi:hypothetical protein